MGSNRNAKRSTGEKIEREVAERKAKARRRSPNYPAMSLPDAIEKLKLLYRADGKAGAVLDEALKRMGFGSAHGQAIARVSALRKFGLVEDNDGRIVPTPLGVDIVEFPPGHERYNAAIITAALGPAIYRELVQRHAGHGNIPSDDSLRPELITDKDFNPNAVDGFLKDFRAS